MVVNAAVAVVGRDGHEVDAGWPGTLPPWLAAGSIVPVMVPSGASSGPAAESAGKTSVSPSGSAKYWAVRVDGRTAVGRCNIGDDVGRIGRLDRVQRRARIGGIDHHGASLTGVIDRLSVPLSVPPLPSVIV